MVAVLALAGAGVAFALTRSDEDGSRPTPTPSPTALDGADLSSLPIARASFCDALDGEEVEQALDGAVSAASSYDSGQRAELAPGVRDVSHEFSCTFRGAAGAEARVWVFAEPVRPAVARQIVRDARSAAGCRALEDVPTFGTPSVGTSCRAGKPPRSQVTLRGLFGDAWLSCQLAGPTGEPEERLAERAERWCVQVATTLATAG